MPMMKPRKRITKKQMKQDKFVTQTFKVFEYVQEHSRTLFLGAIGIIAVLLIGFVIMNSKKQKEIKAEAQLGRAQIAYQAGDYTNAIRFFEPVLRLYKGTRSATQATYFLANCHFFLEDYDKALEYYENYATKSHRLPSLAAAAIAGAAACYEQKGEYAEAGRRYEKAASEYQDLYLSPSYLLSAGRCYKESGDTENARRVCQKIVDLYPESRPLQQAKLTLAEL